MRRTFRTNRLCLDEEGKPIAVSWDLDPHWSVVSQRIIHVLSLVLQKTKGTCNMSKWSMKLASPNLTLTRHVPKSFGMSLLHAQQCQSLSYSTVLYLESIVYVLSVLC